MDLFDVKKANNLWVCNRVGLYEKIISERRCNYYVKGLRNNMKRILNAVVTMLLLFGNITASGQTTVKAEDYINDANNGDAVAQYNLGICYAHGWGIEKDDEKAVFWWKNAAEQGYAGGQYAYGIRLSSGRGVLINKVEAFLWIKKAAEQGHSDAQQYLGLMYAIGEGVEIDHTQSIFWHKKAAEQGNAGAQYSLGYKYYEGEGVARDINQAVYWWKKSAEAGDDSAQNALGYLYEIGQGVAQDYQQAAFWYRKAADHNDNHAQCNLGVLYYNGKGVNQDYSEAVRLFRKSASEDYSPAQYYLGMCYQFGQGLGKDLSQAIFWYEKARNQGARTADLFYNLACCYKDKNNLDNALIYANLAVNTDMQAKYLELSGSLYLSKNDIDYAQKRWHELKTKYPESVNDSSEFCNDMLAYEKEMEKSIDYNIPTSSISSSNTFAFIIANESYKRVAPVPYAKNDGNVFAEYCKKTLGIPENNVKVWIDASLGDMQYAISKMQQIAEAYDGDATIILYYAGHGIPSDDQQNSYLLPIDGYNADDSSVSLHALYETLGKLNTKSTLVFLDACFSGAQRNGEMLASTRGVAIKPKQENPEGKLIVLSAAQGDETALPYEEMNHGLFSYFLIKKIRESEGNCTIGELSDYITTNVKRTSISIGDKLQTPKVSAPANMSNWRDLMLK